MKTPDRLLCPLFCSLTATLLLALVPATRTAGAVLVQDGQKVAFLGDSITAQGAGTPSGYVNLVASGLAANGIKIGVIGAGIGGHKSNDMLARLDRDVLEKKPAWMTLSCGVNDVWHGARGVPLETYKTNITAIVDQAQAAGVKVMILTATMIGEDPGNDNNQKLAAYNEFLKTLASEKKCPLADLNAEMQSAVAAARAKGAKGNVLTRDGVHMNPTGDQMMATGILRAFGLDDAQLTKAHEAWLDIPNAVKLTATASLTLRDYQKLQQLAAAQGKSVEALLDAQFAEVVKTLQAK